MTLTIIIILGILLLAKVIDFSTITTILCVILAIIFLPEILSFLFNLIVGIMSAIMEFAF